MQLEDAGKIRGIVYSSDNIKEASRLLRNSLSPMGKAGFVRDDMKQFDERIESIRAELSQLENDLISEIYK